AGELHVHQTGSQRREGAVTGDLQAIGQQVQLAEPADELGGVVGLVPCLGEAVDLGGQRARRGPGVELLAGDVLEEGEVVGGAGLSAPLSGAASRADSAASEAPSARVASAGVASAGVANPSFMASVLVIRTSSR